MSLKRKKKKKVLPAVEDVIQGQGDVWRFSQSGLVKSIWIEIHKWNFEITFIIINKTLI